MTKWRTAVPWTTPRVARALSAAAALAVAGTGFVTPAAAQDAAATPMCQPPSWSTAHSGDRQTRVPRLASSSSSNTA